MGRIPINLRREAPQIDTGVHGASQGFGQAGTQMAGQGQQAAAQGAKSALLGAAEVLESVDNILDKHEAEQKAAENSSDMANGRAKTEALYQDAWEKSQKTTNQSDITQFYKAANDRAGELANGKNDDGVPYFRNKEARQAYEVWLTGKKTQQRGVAISRRVNLSKQATAARFDVSEGSAIANAGKVTWTTSSDALTNVRVEQEKLVQIANARHESGQMTADAALKHSNATVYKLQDNFCEQALAEIYSSPMPPEALKGRVAEYKKAVDLVANELPADVRQKYKAGADQVLAMAGQQQKAREQAAKKASQDQKKANLETVYSTMDVNGNITMSPQQLKMVNISGKEKQAILKDMAKDSQAIKQTEATNVLASEVNARIREYDPNQDPAGEEKLKIYTDLAKLPAALRSPLASEFKAIAAGPDTPNAGNGEAVKAFGKSLESTLGLVTAKGKKRYDFQPTFGKEEFVYTERLQTYGRMVDDFRKYAANHTGVETVEYANKVLKPWRESDNLNATYEAYTRPSVATYKAKKPATKLATGEVLMRDKTNGKLYKINKSAGTYEEVK